MKINQLIQEKRRELSMTQEQVASYLGVSATAVHKWEKGTTYPDITLLPALARLLKTDLNTLLSFQEDLTDIEIENFVNELDSMVREQGYETAFQAAVGKIQEYPTCDRLLFSAAIYLEGALFLYGVPEEERYKERLEVFYLRMSRSGTPEIRDRALEMLISYNRNRGDFAQAEELIRKLPSSAIEQQEQLAVLYTRQGNYEEAKKLWERRILDGVTRIQTALMNLMEIAVKEERREDAAFYADRYERISGDFAVTDWIAYSARLQLAVEWQDEEKCLAVLARILPAMKKKWHPEESPLYRDIARRDPDAFSDRLTNVIRDDLENREELAFIRENAEFRKLMAENSLYPQT